MGRPRVKPKVMIWRSLGLRFCIRPLNGTFVFLAIIDIRARDLIRVLGLEGHMRHLKRSIAAAYQQTAKGPWSLWDHARATSQAVANGPANIR